ncbi:LysE family translocator [Pseudomonas protegens]|uniref:LysE family translocator n=1 Tax=Pseudomonas protegens TaxID=380021 RepID=UPI000E1EE3B7|nr:LysE family transporter [Pseudomonas protegens]AXK53794.1 lysine transporter LysE [Pseudomonas protegens]
MHVSYLVYLAPLLSLALLWSVAVITPGPNFFTTAQLAASCSRRHGLFASLGVASGTVLWGLAGGLGIKSLFSAAPALFVLFKVAGGCYLIYLGLKQFKRKPALDNPTANGAVHAERSLFSAYRLGFLGNMTNPKSALFVATIFATSMPASPPPLLLGLAVLIMAGLSLSWYCCVALFFASSRVAGFYARARRWLDRLAGGCYVLFGGHLLANR